MEPFRFFKVLRTDFETESSFELPSSFIRTLNNAELNSKKAVLKSSKGLWKVGVKKCYDGLLHLFGKRWEDYVSAHELEMRDFIVFEHIGRLQFNTLVFDDTCCEKDFTTSENDVVCRFFKVLVSGFETSLKLPPKLIRMLNNIGLNPRRAVLESCKGSWEVRVKKCDNGLLHFFGEIWEDYVSAHELEMRDFIVFEHKGRLHFDTLVFDKTCCEKDFATSEEENEEEDNSENDDVICIDSSEDDVEHIAGREKAPCNVSYRTSNSQFQITLPKWTFKKGVANVPLAFAKSIDMLQNGTVKLRNGTGDSWLARLSVYNVKDAANKPPRERVILARLNKFLRENKLEIGDTCTFELVRPSRNQEHVVMDVVFMRRR